MQYFRNIGKRSHYIAISMSPNECFTVMKSMHCKNINYSIKDALALKKSNDWIIKWVLHLSIIIPSFFSKYREMITLKTAEILEIIKTAFKWAHTHHSIIFSRDFIKNVFAMIWAPNPQILSLGPKHLEFLNVFDFPIFNSLIRFQSALNHYHSIIFSWDLTKKVCCPVLGPNP